MHVGSNVTYAQTNLRLEAVKTACMLSVYSLPGTIMVHSMHYIPACSAMVAGNSHFFTFPAGSSFSTPVSISETH